MVFRQTYRFWRLDTGTRTQCHTGVFFPPFCTACMFVSFHVQPEIWFAYISPFCARYMMSGTWWRHSSADCMLKKKSKGTKRPYTCMCSAFIFHHTIPVYWHLIMNLATEYPPSPNGLHWKQKLTKIAAFAKQRPKYTYAYTDSTEK